MDRIFSQLFSQGAHFPSDLHSEGQQQQNYPYQYQQQQRRQIFETPPASSHAIQCLPKVRVTMDDILEDQDNNVECSICLEEQRVGRIATKLPCGHLFCPSCIADWLRRNCCCPVCRYEMPTNDARFESERKTRMRNHRVRFRKRELRNMSVRGLRQLMSEMGVSTADCLEKSELIARLEASPRVELIPERAQSGATEMSFRDLQRLSTDELKTLMDQCHIQAPLHAMDKKDLLQMLLQSGHIVCVDTDVSPRELQELAREERKAKLKLMPVKQLKLLAEKADGPRSRCIEKNELIDLILTLEGLNSSPRKQ